MTIHKHSKWNLDHRYFNDQRQELTFFYKNQLYKRLQKYLVCLITNAERYLNITKLKKLQGNPQEFLHRIKNT